MSIPTSHPWDLAAMQHRERGEQAAASAARARVTRTLVRDRNRARAAARYAGAARLLTRAVLWLDARAVRRSDLTRRPAY